MSRETEYKEVIYKRNEDVIISVICDGCGKEDDFLLYPVPSLSFVKHNEYRALGVGIKFGFWAFAICIYYKRGH